MIYNIRILFFIYSKWFCARGRRGLLLLGRCVLLKLLIDIRHILQNLIFIFITYADTTSLNVLTIWTRKKKYFRKCLKFNSYCSLKYRILGFVFMVLLLWSPVVLPFLPTLMQSWATHNPFKIVEFACISGLYISIMIMIMLWGKRIRKYDDPLLQYGFDLASLPKVWIQHSASSLYYQYEHCSAKLISFVMELEWVVFECLP